jgi:hypothetical protein
VLLIKTSTFCWNNNCVTDNYFTERLSGSPETLYFYRRYVMQLVYQPTAVQLLYLTAKLDFSTLPTTTNDTPTANFRFLQFYLIHRCVCGVTTTENRNICYGYDMVWYLLNDCFLNKEEQVIKTNKCIISKTKPSKHVLYRIKINGAKTKKSVQAKLR